MSSVPHSLRLPDGRLVATLHEMVVHAPDSPVDRGIAAKGEPGPAFDELRADLQAYVEIVDTQQFSVADEAEQAVRAHGVRHRRPSGYSSAVEDLYWEDGAVFFRHVERPDLSVLIPDGKHDLEAANRAIATGFPSVEPILSDLLACIQDYNWPIAQQLWPFLGSLGAPLRPHIAAVFEGDDDVWKYWCVALIESMPLADQQRYMGLLERIAEHPTPGEVHEEVAMEARALLASLRSAAVEVPVVAADSPE